jgi:hypothetical protein
MDSSTVYFENCNNYLQSIISVLSIEELEKLSKEHKFIQKEGILDLKTGIKLFTYAADRISSLSLVDYCSFIEEQTSKSIKKQSVAQRFSQKSVNFAAAILGKVLASQLKTASASNKKFKKIMLVDSTGFEVCPQFNNVFKGAGGSGSGSSVKIQYAFDLISGSISLFEITNGVTPDYKYSSKQNIEEDVLYIQDLGYFKTDGFEKIQNQNGYFISRYSTSCNLYTSQDKKEKGVDFIALVAMFLSLGKASSSTNYYLSSSKRLPIRLVMFPIPEHIAKERMDKRSKKGKKTSEPSEKTVANSMVTIFITNVPEDILSDEQIKTAYRLRWAIELTFKIWKSIFKLDEVKSMSLYRYLTLFCFKLIMILIDFQVVTSIVSAAKNNGVFLSLYSCCALFKTHFADRFHECILQNKQKELAQLRLKMEQQMLTYCRLDTNKNRIRICDILQAMP